MDQTVLALVLVLALALVLVLELVEMAMALVLVEVLAPVLVAGTIVHIFPDKHNNQAHTSTDNTRQIYFDMHLYKYYLSKKTMTDFHIFFCIYRRAPHHI